MDTKQNRTVVLLSIHPVYVERLLEGSKCVELRKTRLAKEIDYVIIYSTSPVQKVVGYFSVAKVAIGLPKAIWSEYKHVAGIKSSEFVRYYEGAKQAVAIEVERMHKLPDPLPLSILGKGLRPPQSFQYLDISTIKRLNKYKPIAQQCTA
jgi:predicted transcriptional regulator